MGALLLFDISGFFDNINPSCAAAIFHNLGFSDTICAQMTSFLIGREASIRVRDYISPPFPILSGTPQGSPLLPILSALYMSSLLEMAKSGTYSDLSLYVDDGAIYSVSAMTGVATEKARALYETTLTWLRENGLRADPDKSKLMVFIKPC
jgi:hypothetical protein